MVSMPNGVREQLRISKIAIRPNRAAHPANIPVKAYMALGMALVVWSSAFAGIRGTACLCAFPPGVVPLCDCVRCASDLCALCAFPTSRVARYPRTHVRGIVGYHPLQPRSELWRDARDRGVRQFADFVDADLGGVTGHGGFA